MINRDDPDNDGDDDRREPETAAEMDEFELLSILKTEEMDAAGYYQSELAKDQGDALERYYGAPYGNEVEGRSKVCTHDVEDTINWIMPALMRPYMSRDDLVSCAPSAPEDENNTETAAQYLEYILFVDNPGVQIIHDLAFDGLLQRIGVVSVQWAEPEKRAPEVLEGLSDEQVAKITTDPTYEVLESDEAPGAGEQPTYSLKVQRRQTVGRVKIENVPPEEIAISRRSRALPSRNRSGAQTSGYVRRKQDKYLGDVLAMFPDRKDDLESPSDTIHRIDDVDMDPRVLSRFQNESLSTGAEKTNSERRRKVDFLTEYLWIDFDGDGTVELRRILRVGDVILENLAVDDCEFKGWSPIRIAHKAIGRSLADTIVELQRIRTTMMRLMLDSLSQSLVPRTAVNMQMADESTIDELLDAEVGGVVRVNGDVRMAVSPLMSPDVSAPALQALEYVDQKSEQQSGVTRHAQGISPDAITKTAAGIENLQAAANERIELIGKWLGVCVEEILGRALGLIVSHQDRARWVKVQGRGIDVDPRRWSDEMAVLVHVAGGSANRQQRLANLAGIAAKQEQAIQVGGLQNPVCGVTHLLATYTAMTTEMGFKDPKRFWNDPAQAEQVMQQAAANPKPDPKTLEVQQKGEIAKAELAQKSEMAAAELQHKTQAAQAEMQVKAQASEREATMKAQIEERKAAAEMMLGRERIQAEMALARERMLAELELERAKMMLDAELRRQEIEHNRAVRERDISAGRMNGKTTVSDGVRMGGEVG